MKDETTKGFTCVCGEVHKYPLYVYAHWRDVINFICPQCQSKYTLIMGYAELKKRGKGVKK